MQIWNFLKQLVLHHWEKIWYTSMLAFVESIQTNLFSFFQLVYESPVGVPGMNVYFYASYYTHYYGFKMTWSTF